MAKDLRDLIEAAEVAISTYRRPNVGEAKERLSEVLRAAGMGGIGQFDSIDSISEEAGAFHIRTSYTVRGCEGGDNFELPSPIVDADDPLAAARKWGLEQQISATEDRVNNLRQGLEREEKKLAEMRSALGVEGAFYQSHCTDTPPPSREKGEGEK
jgi:hypothetical protein